MGEYAEMMIDGTCCEACGEFMGDDGPGHARYCSAECAKDRGAKFECTSAVSTGVPSRRTLKNRRRRQRRREKRAAANG